MWFLLFLEKEIEAPRNANDLVQVQQLWCYMAGGLTASVCLAPKSRMFPLMKPEHHPTPSKKEMSLMPFSSFVGHWSINTAPGRKFQSFIFLSSSIINSRTNFSLLLWAAPVQSCGPWCRNLTFPGSRSLHHPPSSLVCTVPACARCFRKQILCIEFPDHSSQTTEGWGLHFLYSVISIFVNWCIFRASWKGEGETHSQANNSLV